MDKSYHLESRCRTGFSWPLQITALYLSFLCRYPGSLWDFLVLWGPFQISGHILLLLWPLSDDKLHPLRHNSPLSSENARYHLGGWPADGSASYLLYLVIQSRKLWTLCKNYLFVIRWNGFFFSEIYWLQVENYTLICTYLVSIQFQRRSSQKTILGIVSCSRYTGRDAIQLEFESEGIT